jgi:hypothetical protein
MRVTAQPNTHHTVRVLCCLPGMAKTAPCFPSLPSPQGIWHPDCLLFYRWDMSSEQCWSQVTGQETEGSAILAFARLPWGRTAPLLDASLWFCWNHLFLLSCFSWRLYRLPLPLPPLSWPLSASVWSVQGSTVSVAMLSLLMEKREGDLLTKRAQENLFYG